MKTEYKNYTIKYKFLNSVWEHEKMTVHAMNIEQARDKVLKEISMAYGSQILAEVKILN